MGLSLGHKSSQTAVLRLGALGITILLAGALQHMGQM